jgi:hypothetical protein
MAAWNLNTTDFQHIIDFLNTSKAPVDAKNTQKSLEMLHEEMAKWTPRYQQKALAAEELGEVRRKRAEAAAEDNEMDDDTDEKAYSRLLESGGKIRKDERRDIGLFRHNPWQRGPPFVGLRTILQTDLYTAQAPQRKSKSKIRNIITRRLIRYYNWVGSTC